MNTDQAATTLALGWLVAVFLLYLIEIMGTSWYDLNQIKKQRQRLKHPYARRYRNKPMISVIVLAYNADDTIEECLDSIFSTPYRKVEAIVVDTASSDETRATVKRYAKRRAGRSIQVTSKRKRVAPNEAIQVGFRKSKGDLILILQAHERLSKNFLHNASVHFAEEDIDILIPQVVTSEVPRVSSLLQEFDSLKNAQLKKLGFASFSEHSIKPAGAVLTRNAYRRLKNIVWAFWTNKKALSEATSQQLRAYYASDIKVVTQPKRTYAQLFRQRYRQAIGQIRSQGTDTPFFLKSQPKTFRIVQMPLILLRNIALILEPFVMVYFIFLAIDFNRPAYFLIAWLGLTLLLGLSVWKNEHLKISDKIKLALLLPVVYNLLYIVRFMDIIALLLAAFNLGFARGTHKKADSPFHFFRLASKAAKT